ncbi:MAG: nuclear transport factor 2 family protein [Pseudomonadota bacterium]
MKTLATFAATALCLTLALSNVTYAQDALDDESNLLTIINDQWAAEQDGDDDAIRDMLHRDFYGWTSRSPVPQDRRSTLKWSDVQREIGRVVSFEIFPLNIIVSGDTAVVHYYYTTAFKNKDGKTEVTNGRYTDVLVRSDESWKFLAWSGGSD